MTSSRDSLIPDVPDKSEAQARCSKALQIARDGLDVSDGCKDPDHALLLAGIALEQIIETLEDGK